MQLKDYPATGLSGVFYTHMYVSPQEYEERKKKAIEAAKLQFEELGMSGYMWNEIVQSRRKFFYTYGPCGAMNSEFFTVVTG